MAGVTKGTEMTKKPGRCGVSLQKQGDGFPLLPIKNACFQLDRLKFENWKSQFATSNSDKFPPIYMFQLSKNEVEILRTKISSTN